MNSQSKHRTYKRKSASKPSSKSQQWTPHYRVPLTKSAVTGIIAENLVSHYLRLHGWTIMARNYQTPQGEIDIIACKWNADLIGYPTVIFVEVKSRCSPDALDPALNVTRGKQNKLSKTIKHWIAKHTQLKAVYRCDVAAVRLQRHCMPRLKYIPSAFCVKQDFGW